MGAAAFFDLDRTLLRRSSALALAGPFRRRGLIGRRALLRAALWQVLFVARGASGEAVRRAAEEGLGVLRGMTPVELEELVADALARDLGFDGAIGTVAEVVGGRYTGRTLQARHAVGKAAAVRDLAEREGIDLAASTAYSDSHTDLPFLEAVGHPIAVNPDRQLRRVAAERGWPVLRFRVAHAA